MFSTRILTLGLVAAWSAQAAVYPSASHPILEAFTENFVVEPPSGNPLKPECLRRRGIDLIVLDAGHDDSELSRRSEAKRCRTCPDEFLRPLIHEGHANQAVAWMAFDLMLKDPSLNDAERTELRGMVRFTRLPGELNYGEYEKALGYTDRLNGPITSNTVNRVEHVNHMMAYHRRVADRTEDVTSRTLMQSIHANSSGYYNAADYLWVMRPQNITDNAWSYLRSLAAGFASEMPPYFMGEKGDSEEVRRLKDAVRPTYVAERTRLDHYDGTRMLGPLVGNAQTIRALSEGFFMDGKAGELVYRELSDPAQAKSLRFNREGREIASYAVSDLYVLYARSLVKGISNQFGCR